MMMPVLSRPPSVPATTPTLSPHPSTPSTPSTLSRPFHPQEPTVLPSPYARVPSPLWKVASASAHVRSCDACDQPTYISASEDALFRSLAGALYQRGVGGGGEGTLFPSLLSHGARRSGTAVTCYPSPVPPLLHFLFSRPGRTAPQKRASRQGYPAAVSGGGCGRGGVGGPVAVAQAPVSSLCQNVLPSPRPVPRGRSKGDCGGRAATKR